MRMRGCTSWHSVRRFDHDGSGRSFAELQLPSLPPIPDPSGVKRMATNPADDDLETRITSIVQGAIEQRLGPIVDQLSPLVAQLQANQRPTGGESHYLYTTLPPSGGQRVVARTRTGTPSHRGQGLPPHPTVN